MKFNQLRDVVAIAERGSLRAAARHLALAQPALTRSVHELERELGVPLFERRARGMILTPMGEAFVRRANAVLSEVRRARDEVEQLHGGTRGRVVAGPVARRAYRAAAGGAEAVPRALSAGAAAPDRGLVSDARGRAEGRQRRLLRRAAARAAAVARADSGAPVRQHAHRSRPQGPSAGQGALAARPDRRRMGDHLGHLQGRGRAARSCSSSTACRRRGSRCRASPP